MRRSPRSRIGLPTNLKSPEVGKPGKPVEGASASNCQKTSSVKSDVRSATDAGQSKAKIEFGESEQFPWSTLAECIPRVRKTESLNSEPKFNTIKSEKSDDDDDCTVINLDSVDAIVKQENAQDTLTRNKTDPETAKVTTTEVCKDQQASNLNATKTESAKVQEVKLEPPMKKMKKSNFTQPKIFGFARGLQPKEIVGACNNAGGELTFLMRWHGINELDLVNGREANVKCPQVVTDFYLKRVGWTGIHASIPPT